ncbi:MAG: hypothetical protein M5U14_16880 [Acidimicrobiia bacterium]|nr:hypothetical protein [Acidimicrobiia bacterium]
MTRRAGRLLLAALPVLVVVGVAVGAVGWFARRPYYVGLDGEQVALYRGVPGGLLWWDPTLEERADLTTDDLTEAQLRDLDGGHRFSSRSGAEAFVARLERDAEERDAATTTTVTTTAPDTAPPTTATPADGAAPGAPTT